MTVNDFLLDFAIASLFIMVGQLIRAKVGLVQKFFVPASMIAGFIALALAYFADSSLFEGLLPAIMEQLSLFQRFTVFVNGVFDLTAVVYYLSVAGIFLLLSVQSLEKRRYN